MFRPYPRYCVDAVRYLTQFLRVLVLHCASPQGLVCAGLGARLQAVGSGGHRGRSLRRSNTWLAIRAAEGWRLFDSGEAF